MNAKELARQIEAMYRAETPRPFSWDDINSLRAIDPVEWDLFWTYWLHFEADVAGYAQSARRFLRGSREQIEKAREGLCLSFFEAYPNYRIFEPHITRSSTPQLFDEMQQAEELRLQLIALFNLIEEQS